MEGDRMKLWFLALAIPGLVHAYYPTAERECTNLNLQNETLGAVRNQGKISWCYAFTASDMLSHTFNKEQISAADVALNYNESLVGRIMTTVDPNGNPHETGFNKIALSKAMKDGYCPELVFPSETWIKVIDGKEEKIPMPEAMKEIAGLHKIRHTLTSKNLPFHYQFKNIGRDEFLSLIQTKKLRNFYSNLRHEACRDDRVSFDARWKVKMAFKNKKVFSRISEQLESGRLIGLDYDARILESREHQGVKLSELHTSSIVGRRWNRERSTCEYLVRDSHGVQCSRYDPSYECSAGNVWLGESQIYGSLISIVYMLSASH
jgi:hypothetical protein